MAANNNNRPPASLNKAVWRSSDARQLMAQDIIDNLIPREGPFNPEELHNRLYADHPFFANFPFDKARFRSRVYGLRKILTVSLHWAAHDDDALAQDLALHPKEERDPRGRLRWDGSDAQRLLASDMEDGKHLRMKPKDLWLTKPAIYGLFELTVFRKHLDQAKQAGKRFGTTPGQNASKKKRNPKKVGGRDFQRPYVVLDDDRGDEDDGATDEEDN